MNRNQLEGSATDLLGAMQQWLGEVTNNPRQQGLGAARRVEGKVRLGVGNVEHAIAASSRRLGRSASPKQQEAGLDNGRAKLKRVCSLAQEVLVG